MHFVQKTWFKFALAFLPFSFVVVVVVDLHIENMGSTLCIFHQYPSWANKANRYWCGIEIANDL